MARFSVKQVAGVVPRGRLAQNVGWIDPGPGIRSGSRAYDGGIHREEEIARHAGRKVVGELDTNRPVFPGDDHRPKVMERRAAHVRLPVPAQPRGRQVGVIFSMYSPSSIS